MSERKSFSVVYVAKSEFIDELREEIKDVSFVEGNLVFSSVKIPDVCFAEDIWLNPVIVEFSSISEAAKILRGVGKYWVLNPLQQVRRSRLIEEQLPKIPSLLRSFPLSADLPEMGCFSLLDKNTLVFATLRWKKWLEADKAKQMIFTIKLQGKTDLGLINQFKTIPNSRVIHLFYNKHEVCFFHPAPPALYY